MSENVSSLWERLHGLQQAFDGGFALPRQTSRHETWELLVVESGRLPWGVPLADLTGLHPLPPIEPLPQAVPGLLGLAAIRGQVIPVYCLAALLAEPREAADCHWLLLARTKEPVGFAVEGLIGHLRPDRRQVLPISSPPAGDPVKAMLQRPASPLPVVDLADLAARLSQGAEEPSHREAA